MATTAATRRIFWGLLLLAVALRVVAFNPFAIHWADEAIQYLEQAHRLVFRYGLVPWEFRYGIRSWLMPLLLVPPMALGDWIAPGTSLYLIMPRALVAVLNLSSVAAAWTIGARTSRQAAIVAMAVTALWIECVFFSVSLLSEALATSSFLVAVALLDRESGFGRAMAAGALMALSGLIRFQYAPAIAVYLLIAVGRDWRLWRALVAGGIPVALGGAVIDLSMGQIPYQWFANNYRMNIVEDRMGKFGVSSWTYLLAPIYFWRAGAVIIPLLAALVWREHGALLAAAAANLLLHQLMGHKEYRFIWLTFQIMILVAAVGSTRLINSPPIGRWFVDPGGARATLILILLWGLGSLGLASTQAYRETWRDDGSATLLARNGLRDPAVCGLAVPLAHYPQFGYAFLGRDTPLFLLPNSVAWSPSATGQLSGAFNATVSWGGPPHGFTPVACNVGPDGRRCLYRRPGGCKVTTVERPYLAQLMLVTKDM